MNRDEKIRKAAEQYTKQQTVTDSLYNDEGDMYECVPNNAFIAGAEWMESQFKKVDGGGIDWYMDHDHEYICGFRFDEPIELPCEVYIKKEEQV